MFLKSLNLKNFRNYKKVSHKFGNKITVLVGDNAQGKSNFLEAIYFLAAAKPPKAEKDEELIRNGEEVLRVEGVVQKSDFVNQKSDIINLLVAILIMDGRLQKKVEVNGIPRRVLDYSENLAVVIFAPEDINMVAGSPSLRRDHVDHVISQVDRQYKKSLVSYENVVTRKNKLLKAIKEGFAKSEELNFWCGQQLKYAVEVATKRQEFFGFINSAEKKFGSFKYDYLPSVLTATRLLEYQTKEIDATVSLVGPHRDDFIFLLENKDLSKYGSRGEQRTSVLDLKIAEASFIEQKLNSRPVLLLDDIFSELDLEHRKHVIDLAKLQQTIITTVEMDNFLKKELQGAEVLRVEDGKIVGLTNKM